MMILDFIKLPRRFDARIKLTHAQETELKSLYAQGTSFHKLSKIFNVDRRTIKMYLFPEYRMLMYEKRKKQGIKTVYNLQAVQNVRQKKKDLLQAGKIAITQEAKTRLDEAKARRKSRRQQRKKGKGE